MRWQYWTQWLLITGLCLAAVPRSGNAQTAPPQERLISEGVARRLHNDAQAVLQLSTNGMLSTTTQKEVAGELKRIEEEIPRLPRVYAGNFRAILPINPLHKRIFEAQAAVWRAFGAHGIVAWKAVAWDPLPLIGPIPSKPDAELSAAMMNNEYRAGTFNLSNAGENDENVTLRISSLPGGENPSWITVLEVAWTDTKSGQPIAAALPQAQRDRDGFVIHVPSGLTRQVWLTFHPTNLPAGLYQGHVIITGHEPFEIPVSVRIYPMHFPGRLTLHVGGWDYTDRAGDREITMENRPLIIEHLKEHFVDSPWASSAVLPAGEFGPDERFVAQPNISAFDEWLGRWPEAARYCVYLEVKDNFAGAQMGTPQFEKRVGRWIQFWAQHVQDRGLKPAQLILLLVDEPARPEQDAIILAWTKAIHAAHTGVKIWEDPIHPDPFTANQEMLAQCDILSPNRVKFLQNPKVRDYFSQHRPPGPELAFYSCSGPMPLLDPYTYVRLQAWSAWQNGAQSSYFWSFSDCGRGSSWNEYTAPRSNYAPFFLDKNSITDAKHLEALRESAEDYEYLEMLQKAVVTADKEGRNGPKLDRARKLLAEAAQRVCNAPGASALVWATPKDRSVADRARIDILDALSELQNAGE